MKRLLLRLVSFGLAWGLYPVMGYRTQFWFGKVAGFAFTIRNRGKFDYLGAGVFLPRDATIVGPEHISIGDRTSFGRGCILTVWIASGAQNSGRMCIGPDGCVGVGAHITAACEVSIGANVLFGNYVTISDNSHGTLTVDDVLFPPRARELYSKGPVSIGDSVWIGDKVTILGGVTVGRGAVIGANSVVTKDVPEYAVVCGSPAKVIKFLSV